MKILVLAALLVASTSGRPGSSNESQDQSIGRWPWQVGQVYKYEVQSHTLARLQDSASSGTAIRATFLIRVKNPGLLQAKLQDVQHVQFHQELSHSRDLPKDLPYKAYKQLEQQFEVIVDGGRVKSLNIPATVSLQNENLLKGLVSALQVDLSPYRSEHNSHNFFDQEIFQGQFTKKEVDVTGDCETLYTVSPLASEWRRELPNFANKDEPIEITKSKNYGRCAHRVAYHFGVPEGAEWTGAMRNSRRNQLINRSTDSRIVAGKQGPIYKTEVTSTVHVRPLMYGNQKAEVLSFVSLNLLSVQEDDQTEWAMPEQKRLIKNLLYTLTKKSLSIDNSKENWNEQQESEESNEYMKDTPVTFVNDDITKINEQSNVGLYLTPQAKENKNAPMITQKLTQEIAQQLQNPNNLPKSDALTKFNILVRFISSMTYEQIVQTSRGIELAKSSNSIVKMDMWMVYRDAVAQAGTMPAYQQIQTWIKSKKLTGEEAAQVIATLPTTLLYPTKDLMIQFFNLAMCDEVREQQFLNSTALISATRLINMGQVNNDTAHSYYPTHMYGRLSHKQDLFVLEEILPRLRDDMKDAVEKGHSHRVQVDIKAIGNLGHRAILDVFAPYLQGEIKVSTYLRRLIIENLHVLAQQNDHHTRAVLYSILRNTAEPNEVRLAAIDTIFMCNPTVTMMQAMAQMTNEDPSVHVRAALKSAIVTAAELKDPRYFELAKTAQAAKEQLTEEEFGAFYSKKQYKELFDYEDDLDLMNVISYIASENDLLPKSIRYALYNKMQGWNYKNTISASMSNARQFYEYFQEKMNMWRKPSHDRTELNHKYTAEKIAEMLKIKRDPENPLEASLKFELMNQQRFFPFSELNMQQLPDIFMKTIESLAKGVDYHYTKLLNPSKVTVMFPVAMGVPFIYKYREPTLVHIQGKTKVQIEFPSEKQKDFSANMDKEVQFMFARNIDGSVGFFDTLSDQYASAGVVSKIQINIPLKAKMQLDSGKIRVHLEPLNPDQDTTIAHFSVWPYTANQKKDSQVTVSQDPTTKIVSRPNKVSSIDSKFGLAATGTQFQIQGYSYSKDYRNVASMLHGDLISSIVFATYQKDLAETHYNFKYLGKQSQNKALTLTAVYGKYYNQVNTIVDALKPSNMAVMTPDSQERRKEIVNRVSSGIKSAKVHMVDMSATFEGSQKSDYVLTAAIADSRVSTKIQCAIFAGRINAKLGNNQVNAVATVIRPAVYSLNFLDALKDNIKTSFNADIKYGQSENGKMRIEGFMERTKKYAEILKKQPLAKQCIEEMEKNNYYQPACHDVILMAHSPDHLKASVTYKDVSPVFKNMAWKVFRIAQHWGFWFTDDNLLKTSPEGKLEIEADMSYVERTFNLLVNSRAGELRVSNAPMPKVASAALAFYSPIHMTERVGNQMLGQQYLPYCSVDGTCIKTFSNRTYDYSVSRSWHVVIQDDAKFAGRYGHSTEQLVVLSRRPNEKQQEVYISYRSETGKSFEITMKPAESASHKAIVKVDTNLEKISEGELTMYWDDTKKAPLLEYYFLTDGVVLVNIDEDRLRALYDGQRLVIFTDKNRNNTRGICGYMSGDARDDYQTPYGIVDSPAHFAASFALNHEDGEPQTMNLQEEAKKLAYQRLERNTAIMRSDKEWQEAMRTRSHSYESMSSQNVYRVRSYIKSESCQLEQQVQYFENHGEICITTTSMPACSTRCSSEGYQVQAAQVVCRPKSDQEFRMYINQIRQGQNPQVKGVSQIKQFRVPKECSA